MKVLLVHNFYRSGAPGGEDVAFLQERQLLEQSGMDVVVYTKSNDDVRSVGQTVTAGLRVRWAREVHRELTALLRRERPQIAHFHNTFPLITASGYAACQEQDVPVVQTLHNYRLLCLAATFYRNHTVCEQCRPGQPVHGVLHRCYKGSLPTSAAIGWMLWRNWQRHVYTELVDLYVALTEFSAAKFRAAGISNDQVVVKPNFVEIDADISERRADNGKYAVFAGRLSDEKGVFTLLKAWQQLRDVPLWVVGDGPALNELRAIAKRESLPIDFLGMLPRPEVLRIISNAAMQIVPSQWYEGFPLVIVEAYGCGTPVIASRIGSLTEVVDPQRTGRLFPAGDHNALALCVRELWADPAMRRRLGDGAYAHFSSMYTRERNMAKLREIFEIASRRHEVRRQTRSVKPSS